MSLPQADWLAVWKIYHYPYFFWTYTAVSLAIRSLARLRVNSAAPGKTWLLSTTVSLMIVPAVPLVALPALTLVTLAAGEVAAHSLLMALPIALSVGLCGGLIDCILLRLLQREAVGRKKMWVLFRTNLLVAFLAVGAVVALMLAHPVEIIAQVKGWR